MRIRTTAKDISDQKTDLAVLFAYAGDRSPRGVAHKALIKELATQMKAESFKGHAGDRLIWNANGQFESRRFMVIGLGKERDVPGEAIRLGCSQAARAASRYSARSMAVGLPSASGQLLAQEARAAVEGALLGAYQYDKYLTDPGRRAVKLGKLELCVGSVSAAVKKAVAQAGVGAEAVCLARDLVNEPPSRLTPSALAKIAASKARSTGLRCKILGVPELRKLGLTALLAVSRGSTEPPRVVHLTYKPQGGAKKKIVLVGKGVTFDSGGLNLKPGASMSTMKCDMAGSAVVLAAMTTLGRVGCRTEVHAFLGLTENMTGGAAYKPDDILDTYAGKTVEVDNTDAEGRLVLCDLLAYAADLIKPDYMVDLATLTGACVVALGKQATGVFSRHDTFRQLIIDAGSAAGEKLWPLPMYDEYLQLIQKGPADLKNVGGRWGGAITAALFLGEFVPRKIPWVHLDIAGPSFVDTYSPEELSGATGAGVLTLVRWLERC
jgi:leucyl aminopeptidase